MTTFNKSTRLSGKIQCLSANLPRDYLSKMSKLEFMCMEAVFCRLSPLLLPKILLQDLISDRTPEELDPICTSLEYLSRDIEMIPILHFYSSRIPGTFNVPWLFPDRCQQSTRKASKQSMAKLFTLLERVPTDSKSIQYVLR